MTQAGQTPNREWWAQRWIDVLESFGRIPRLARARNYAREGNVLKIEFQGAKVFALVQGTAPDPYKVSLSMDQFDDEQWQYVVESLAERAIFSAKLLSGEMPQNIEEAFTANGLSLFPLTKFDIHSRCSCPDKANPCKHIGAVYYLLGDRFSEDPFVLFQLRGRTKEQIITELRQLRSREVHGDAREEAELSTPNEPDPTAQATEVSHASNHASNNHTEISPEMVEKFWQYNEQLSSSLVVITPPPGSETVLDVLGPIPLKSDIPGISASVSAQVVMEYLRSIYTQVSQQAVMLAMTAGTNEKSG
jgi:uncharacterized Zn finger protein